MLLPSRSSFGYKAINLLSWCEAPIRVKQAKSSAPVGHMSVLLVRCSADCPSSVPSSRDSMGITPPTPLLRPGPTAISPYFRLASSACWKLLSGTIWLIVCRNLMDQYCRHIQTRARTKLAVYCIRVRYAEHIETE